MSAVAKKMVTVELAELKMLNTDFGGFGGYCSVFGNVDRNGDVIEKGAFAPDVLASLITDGFVALNHNWDDIGIGTIGQAHVDSIGLYIETEFHSHNKAQEVRTWMAERAQRGKAVKMSFAFNIAERKARPGGGFSITKVDELYEVTVANVPVNTEAEIIALKSLGGPQFKSVLGDRIYENMTIASLERLSSALWYKVYDILCWRTGDPELEEQLADLEIAYAEYVVVATKVIRAIMSGKHAETAKVAAKSLKMLMDVAETKAVSVKAGRKLSKASRSRIEPHVQALRTAADDLQTFLDESDADDEEKSLSSDTQKNTAALKSADLPTAAQLRAQSLRIQSRIAPIL